MTVFKTLAAISVVSRNKISGSLLKQLKLNFGKKIISNLISKEDHVEIVKMANKSCVITKNRIPIFISLDGGKSFAPTVKCLHRYPSLLKGVVVDKGAIKHIISGANVMAPGLLKEESHIPEDVMEGDFVSVFASGKLHAMAMGRMMMSYEEVVQKQTGVSVEVLNHIGDSLYGKEI